MPAFGAAQFVRIDTNAVHAGPAVIALSHFTELFTYFLKCNPDTASLEEDAADLAAINFKSYEATRIFLKGVGAWGGGRGPGIMSRAVEKNEPVRLCERLAAASASLWREPPDCAGAWEELVRIVGIGPTYASKLARFIEPGVCVSLDFNLGTPAQLNCAQTAMNFARLSAECAAVANALNERLVPLASGCALWRAADVEASIFTRLNPGVVGGACAAE